VNISFPSNGGVPLARLLEVLDFGTWHLLNKMFRIIEKARDERKQITKRNILCTRLDMSASHFSRFEDDILSCLLDLKDLFPEEGKILDRDCIPTEKGELVWEVADWVVQVVTFTYFNFTACEVGGNKQGNAPSSKLIESK
jgi:hypothetical protein